jgi:hypothetical protein
MINLPPVIQSMPELVLAKPEFEAKLDLGLKKFVIALTKDLSEEERRLFSEYGKVVFYNDRIHNNMPIDAYAWDYLFFDMRNSEDRYAIMRMVLPFRERYNIVVYSYKFEKDEIIPEADNHLSSFPKIQARREDFECLLLQKRLAKPRWYVSLFSCILDAYHSVKK